MIWRFFQNMFHLATSLTSIQIKINFFSKLLKTIIPLIFCFHTLITIYSIEFNQNQFKFECGKKSLLPTPS